MKVLVALLALLLIPGCGQLRLSPRHSSRTIERAVESTVALRDEGGSIFCSGVILKGYVLTANHCVDHGQKFTVETQGGEPLPAQVMRTWPAQDLALLATDIYLGRGVTFAHYPPSYGDAIFLVGHPRGRYAYSVSRGFVMHPRRSDTTDTPSVWLQHDAAQAKGNSGGPVLNDKGQLVGIVAFGLMIPVECMFDCRGVYQDAQLKGAVHWEVIATFLENRSPKSETLYPPKD